MRCPTSVMQQNWIRQGTVQLRSENAALSTYECLSVSASQLPSSDGDLLRARRTASACLAALPLRKVAWLHCDGLTSSCSMRSPQR